MKLLEVPNKPGLFWNPEAVISVHEYLDEKDGKYWTMVSFVGGTYRVLLMPLHEVVSWLQQ